MEILFGLMDQKSAKIKTTNTSVVVCSSLLSVIFTAVFFSEAAPPVNHSVRVAMFFYHLVSGKLVAAANNSDSV